MAIALQSYSTDCCIAFFLSVLLPVVYFCYFLLCYSSSPGLWHCLFKECVRWCRFKAAELTLFSAIDYSANKLTNNTFLIFCLDKRRWSRLPEIKRNKVLVINETVTFPFPLQSNSSHLASCSHCLYFASLLFSVPLVWLTKIKPVFFLLKNSLFILL